MATTPDRLKAEADQTRAKLAADVDQLANRTSPKRKLHQGSERVRDAARGAKERVMGTTDEAADTVQDKTKQAAGAVRSLPGRAMHKTEGNPLAVGLIAFGAGLLAAALLPESRTEQRAGAQLASTAAPIAEAAKESAAHVAEETKDAARAAGQRVASTAEEAARTTRESARDQSRN